MKRFLLFPALLFVLSSALVLGQGEIQQRSETYPGTNPYLGKKESITNGMTLYRWRCGECHALDATGYRGPDLTAVIASGAADEHLFDVIRRGVPGTEMPPSGMWDNELLQIMAYLRSLNSVTTPAEAPAGNVEHGKQLFTSNCAACHRVNGQGSSRPDVSPSRVARSRRADARNSNPVRMDCAQLRDRDDCDQGRAEDPRDQEERRRVFDSGDGRSRAPARVRESESAGRAARNGLDDAVTFPAQRLSDSDLNDLIGYLTTLRRTNDVAVR
jgi:mono/diheme cytochrome c family protein